MTISKEEYKSLKSKVEAYEDRQAKIKSHKEKMGQLLNQFSNTYSFKYYKNTVIFSVFKDGKTKISIADCNNNDKYDKGLGKIIAVYKAFNIPIDEVVDLVETNCTKIFIKAEDFPKHRLIDSRISYDVNTGFISF